MLIQTTRWDLGSYRLPVACMAAGFCSFDSISWAHVLFRVTRSALSRMADCVRWIASFASSSGIAIPPDMRSSLRRRYLSSSTRSLGAAFGCCCTHHNQWVFKYQSRSFVSRVNGLEPLSCVLVAELTVPLILIPWLKMTGHKSCLWFYQSGWMQAETPLEVGLWNPECKSSQCHYKLKMTTHLELLKGEFFIQRLLRRKLFENLWPPRVGASLWWHAQHVGFYNQYEVSFTFRTRCIILAVACFPWIAW